MPDFVIAEGPDSGKTIDFMFVADTLEEAKNMNNNFMRTPRQIECLRDHVKAHLAKADIVPLYFKNLTAENQKLLTGKILDPLPPTDREKLRAMR